LWISTNKGICKFLVQHNSIKVFDVNNGLPDNEFNQGAYCAGSDGRMYFGGVKGAVSFDPAALKENQYIPPVVITSFRLFNKEVKLPKEITETTEIHLAHEDNNFSFEYAALNFLSPAKNRYAYILEGYDKAWNYMGAVRNVSYTHLDPGTYRFRVKGSNNDGVWNETGRSIVIFIEPAFWQTEWFAILVFLCTSGLIIGFYHQRITKLKKEKNAQQNFSRQLIESQETDRKRIASGLHDGIAQNLLIIKNNSDQIRQLDDIRLIQSEIEEIAQLAKESIDEVREIAYNLHPYQLERLGLTKAIESMLSRIQNGGQLTIVSSLQKIDGFVTKIFEINIYRLIQESLNNILKHSGASEASVSVKTNESEIMIEIEDNGRGFDIGKIGSAEMPGLGLTELSERTKLMDGTLRFNSIPGLGTSVQISIPVHSTRKELA
jgi:signal transduction histidine kinase